MDEQIKAEFQKSGFSLDKEEEILRKCLTYCINYKLSPSDLVSYWEVYYLNRQLGGFVVENEDMEGFLSYIQNEQKENNIKEETHLHIYSSSDVDMLLNDDHDNDVKEGFLGTPVANHHQRTHVDSHGSPASKPVASEVSPGKTSGIVGNLMTPFGQRSAKFVPVFTLNAVEDAETKEEKEIDNLEDNVIRRVRQSERCSLQIHCSQPEPGCKFMYDRMEGKFNFLENRIRRCAADFTASGLYGEPTVATLASQKSIFTVGMICCEGEGHLNEKSILLQGSVEHSGGERVRLDLQKLSQFSLYPGQVIGVEGQNPSGHCFIASKVVDSLPVSPGVELPLAKKRALDNLQGSPSSTRVLSMVIASGPFTTTDNLLFEPFTELLAYASRKQPQLLVLMGPFVDSDHPEIKNGTVDRTFDDIFSIEVIRRLLDYIEYMGSAVQIVLLPSIRDASHDFVFPQPAFDIHPPEDISHQITFLANPSIFCANEVLFGCSTTDILRHLSSEEISRIPANVSSGDRMTRLATHVLGQRSFYPLYPSSPAVPLDLSLAPKALEIPSIPDVLLLPSDLTPFAKVLHPSDKNQVEEPSRCMCVNPGRLAKGIGGGTFVEMNYNCDPDKTNVSIIRI